MQVAAVAARPVEDEPPVAVAIHSARDWPAGLPPMEAPVAVLANPHDQPTNAICGIPRNQALSRGQLSPRPTATHIMILPLSPRHSRPTPTAPDFSVNVSSESYAQERGEDNNAYSAAVQTPLTDETREAGSPEPESSNQPAETHSVTDSGEVDLQHSDSDAAGPEGRKRSEQSPID